MSKKKQSKKIDKAAVKTFTSGLTLGVGAGKTATAFDVKLVLDACARFARNGLDRYATALLAELQVGLNEMTEPQGCEGCDKECEGTA